MDHRPSVRTRLRRTVRICLSKKSPITNCVAIPGRPPSLYSGAISPSMNSQSILPASCTSSCLMLMIWSSRARNRSADPVVLCFFGRIAPSDAATESCFSIRGNRENEFASFQGLRHGNLAISSQQSRQKTTLAQWVRNSSRATISPFYEHRPYRIATAETRVLEDKTLIGAMVEIDANVEAFHVIDELGWDCRAAEVAKVGCDFHG